MSALSISVRPESDAVVVDLNGDVIYGHANTLLRNAVRSLIAEGRTEVHLNLTDVCYVDSSGVGEFISALIALKRVGGHLKLINPGERVQQILSISRLTEIFGIENTGD